MTDRIAIGAVSTEVVSDVARLEQVLGAFVKELQYRRGGTVVPASLILIAIPPGKEDHYQRILEQALGFERE